MICPHCGSEVEVPVHEDGCVWDNDGFICPECAGESVVLVCVDGGDATLEYIDENEALIETAKRVGARAERTRIVAYLRKQAAEHPDAWAEGDGEPWRRACSELAGSIERGEPER